MDLRKLVILSGAGISAESGLKTFRDNDGLWNGHRIEDVATPDAWERQPGKVLEFYNERRKALMQAVPNAAHEGLVTLEKAFNVHVITQNVDDLHERAGSTNVLHLHGELLKMRSSRDHELVYEIYGDIRLGDVAEDGAQLRPDIVWFGEPVTRIAEAIEIVSSADILVIIGTSLQVYPAAGLIDFLKSENIPVYIIDRDIPPGVKQKGFHAIQNTAVAGMSTLLSLLT
jgi:NAD-dependent deacetylase